ncbi:hypothetical protein PSHT_00652 [Puccinia striiformis]|uniref:Uncharacterized protein n=1 Tax=Puccinia striiformis TaxID=27350 RepID=A0A2S4WMF5_9BASI|nr:hypothetical protein PSHT_00652 [Puccinia striiformis]
MAFIIHNKSSGPNRPPSTTEKKREVEEEEKDLEAGTIMEKIEPHDNQQKDKRRSFRRPGILRWSQVKPERTSPRDLKDKISRPTRLLPTETSYVIVRSPLPARDHLPLTSNRSSRARSLDSQRLVNEIRKRRETDLSSGKTVAHPSVKLSGMVRPDFKNGSSIHSRHSRTTSLPSSWDEILHSPAADEPQEARLRLGSVSELWLDFQIILLAAASQHPQQVTSSTMARPIRRRTFLGRGRQNGPVLAMHLNREHKCFCRI